MNDDRTPDAPEATAFARLAAELAELGYEETTDPDGTRTYTATDTNTVAVLETGNAAPKAVLASSGTADAWPDWEITFTATTPTPTQLVILYAALNTANPLDGMTAATAALAIPETAGTDS